MRTKTGKPRVYSSFLVLLLFALTACGGGGLNGDGEFVENSGFADQSGARSELNLELKTWGAWDGDHETIYSQYDAETQTATLSHNDTTQRIAFSQHQVDVIDKYRVQVRDMEGVARVQLITFGADQLRMEMIEPASSWVDVHAKWPIDVQFAEGTEYLKLRVIFSAGEVKVGTFGLIPLDQNGEPLPDRVDPRTDNPGTDDAGTDDSKTEDVDTY